MRTEYLIESAESTLELEPDMANALQDVGRRLASKKGWWGADADAGDVLERTVLRVEPRSPGRWSVRVNDAVGVVSVGDLQLVVQPKIPMAHLLYLFGRSGAFPRLDEQRAATLTSATLWQLVARWFVDQIEALLRRELVRDYIGLRDELSAAQGRIDVAGTTRLYYAGRLAVDCEFEDFAFDTALNRVLKAAASIVAGSVLLDSELRRRAIRVLARMDEVGQLQPTDHAARLDRRTGHYRDAFTLTRHVLQHEGRAIEAGGEVAWTFLMRTPEMVEAGIRQILAGRLGSWRVKKEGRQLIGSSLTFTPDLVFDGGAAVGDVKYKLSAGDWDRSDLYQITAFAEAFHAGRGVIVRFRSPTTGPAPELLVGTKAIHEVTWPADESVEPATAANELASEIAGWLDDSSLGLSA